jgi:DNA-binding NarL/FixJ family response regulator
MPRAALRAPVVAIVAEDEVFARRLRILLADGGVDTVAVVSALEDLLEAAKAEVIVHAGHFDGAELAKQVEALGARVVEVVEHVTPRHVRGALAAGVLGIVREQDVDGCLADAVHAVCSGQLVLPADSAELLASRSLSAREKQVLGLVVIGFSNAEIARKLHLAEATVKSHLTSSFRKLGVRTRSEATLRILDPNTGLGLGILAFTDKGMAELQA